VKSFLDSSFILGLYAPFNFFLDSAHNQNAFFCGCSAVELGAESGLLGTNILGAKMALTDGTHDEIITGDWEFQGDPWIKGDMDVDGDMDLGGNPNLPGLKIYNVKNPTYGAVGDGTTDDYQAIQDAIDDAETNSEAGIVYLPGGNYLLKSPLRIERGITLKGASMGDATSGGSPSAGVFTRLTAHEDIDEYPKDGVMLLVKAASPGDRVHNAKIKDIAFFGEHEAKVGIQFSSCINCIMDHVYIRRCQEHGWLIDDGNYDDTVGKGTSAGNLATFIQTTAGADETDSEGMNGITLRSTTGASPTNKYGTTGTTVHRAILTTNCGNGLEIGDHDSGCFLHVQVPEQGSAEGNGILFRGCTDSQPRVSRKNLVLWYHGMKIEAEAGSVANLVRGHSEGLEIDVASGAAFHYEVLDRVDGDRFETPPYWMMDEVAVPLGFATFGGTSAAQGSVGTGPDVPCIDFPNDDTTSKLDVILPRPFNWNNGKVADVVLRLTGDTAGATNDEDVVLQVKTSTFQAGDNINSSHPEATDTAVVTIAGAYEIVEETVEVDLDYERGDSVYLEIVRQSDNAQDDYTDDLKLLELIVRHESDGPDGNNNDGPFDIPDRQNDRGVVTCPIT
jgi:hypothetical protein